MNTSRLSLHLVVAAALGASALVALTASGAGAETPSIHVLSITQYGPDAGGQFQLVGELKNDGAANLGPLAVNVTFLDAAGGVLFQDSALTSVDALASNERAPFTLSFPPLSGYTHYTYAVEDRSGAPVNHNFTVTVTGRTNDGTYDHVIGTVRNDNDTTAQGVNVVGTAYDAGNLALDVDNDYVGAGPTDLAPGASGPFEIVFVSRRPYDHTALVAQSSTPRSPALPEPAPSSSAVPSPTDSTSGGSGSGGGNGGSGGGGSGSSGGSSGGGGGLPASAPGGPTGTGGPSGVVAASPLPGNAAAPAPRPTPSAGEKQSPVPVAPAPSTAARCADARGAYSLRMSPLLSETKRAGNATLSARLVQAGQQCQAGLPVAFYTRGPGATAFHLSRTLRTDSDGLVRTTYAHPGSDFRWYVRHSGTVSGTGLVHVR